MKKTILFLFLFSSFFLFACNVSPCDCAQAQINNDKKTIKKCDEKVSKMSESEQLDFNKQMVNCISIK